MSTVRATAAKQLWRQTRRPDCASDSNNTLAKDWGSGCVRVPCRGTIRVSMKRGLAALAVALIAIFVFAGCNDYGNTFQNNTGALITTLSPSNVTAGSAQFTLTISGSGFVPQTYITWNNMKLP